MSARARIIFHIGQHKTGSKALQSFCAHNARGLAERGILYPVEENPAHGIRAYAISHYRLFALLRAEVMAACGDAGGAEKYRAAHREFCRPFGTLRGMFDAMEEERARAGAGTMLISAEDLFDMRSAHELEFSMEWVEAGAQILAATAAEFRYEPLTVVYLRRQDHLLAAHYVQFIKGSATNDAGFDDFSRAFAPRLRSRDILAAWAGAFGDARVRARAYEPCALPAGIVPDSFEHVLGFPVPADWGAPARDVESVNATPGRDYVEFMRLLNRRGKQGIAVPPREQVLQAAFAETNRTGAGEWMSPGARRELLAIHAAGNAEIAERFTGRDGAPFFAEPVPADDGEWRQYPGLSQGRIEAIERKIGGQAVRWENGWKKKLARLLRRA
ncbi:MAG TPA: hypothetical protein VG733_02085 [Chthoniobacteraceae bacterium]|nr:hypothetical protein [Chthoniobacteraceae bacterium]